MPTNDQPGAISLLLKQAGVSIGIGPFRTLNFQSGATIVDAGLNVAQIDIAGGGGGTIVDGSVTLLKLANLAQSTIIGRAALAGTGVPTALTPAQVKTLLAIATTDVTGLVAIATSGSAADLTAGSIPAARIAAATITYAMIQTVAASRLLGSIAGGAPAELTAAQVKTLLAIATADVTGLAAIAASGSAADLVAGTIAAARIAAATITLAMQADLAQSTIVGRAALAGTGVPTALTPAQVKTMLAIATTDVTGLAAIASSGSATDLTTGSIPSGRIAAATITYAMIQTVTAGRIIGATVLGAPVELTAAAAKTILAIVPGDVTGIAAIASSGSATDLTAGSIPAARIAAATVTLAMQANVASSTLVGHDATAMSAPQALTAAQAKAVLAIVPADVTGLAAVATSGSATDLTAGSLPAARIAAATVTLAMHANVSATQRVLGRNTAGAGVPEEVTSSQIHDWISSTNGVLLTRTAGAWAALANVTTDNGDIVIADNATPVAPAAGAKLFSKSLAGRSMPAFVGALGRASAIQPFLGRTGIALYYPSAATAVSAFGFTSASITGTGTARTPASTNLFTSMRRVGYVSGAIAGNIAEVTPGTYSQFWRGNAAGLGGFTMVFRFGISDAVLVGTANMFVGWKLAYTDVAPSGVANEIGVGCDNGDTVLQLYAAGTAAQARTSLGVNFPVNTINTDVYELQLYCEPNGSTVRYRVERLNTGDVASSTISLAAALPASTTFMNPRMSRSNGGAASAVGLDFFSMYAETDL